MVVKFEWRYTEKLLKNSQTNKNFSTFFDIFEEAVFEKVDAVKESSG